MDRLREQLMQSQLDEMAEGVSDMSPEDMERLKDMMSELNNMLDQRQRGEEPDFDGFMDKFRKVKPWIVRAKERAEDMENLNEKGTYSQSPAELATFKQFSMCINCLLCYAACPVIANEPDFIGPAAIALGHRYNLDSRDEGDRGRNEIFRGEGTAFSCSFANECSEVCPKNVDPAAAVNQAKLGAVVDWAKGLILPREGA